MRKLLSAIYCALLVFGPFFAPDAHAAAPTLEEALDTVGLTWATSGTPPWVGQTAVTHDGNDAAGSGAIADGAATSMSTTVNGPGTLTFRWKVSSETNNDSLIFLINGVEQVRTSGEADWHLKSFVLPSGSQTLTWTYSKNSTVAAGQDSGWVDQVSFAPACTYSISPMVRAHGYAATNNSVAVTTATNCAWTVSNTNGWITILSSVNGAGTGTVSYAVSANTEINSRTGIVMIAGESFTVQQSGVPCDFSLNPTMRNHGRAATNNSFTVSGTAGCPWSIINTSSWITFTGTTSGVGGGAAVSVPYSVTANLTPVKRTGNVLVANEKFVLSQNAAPCIYELTPTNATHGHAGATKVVDVNTLGNNGNCSWYVDNTNDWITITTNSTGLGSTNFTYLVAPNPISSPRTGTFKVWDQVYTVFQHAAPCNASFTPSSWNADADRDTNVVAVTVPGGCSWSVINTNTWISVSPTSGSDSGNFTCIVNPNVSSLGRTGVVSISNQTFTVRQAGANCYYELSTTNRTHGYRAATNSVDLNTLSICAWTVENTNSWITFFSTSGVGDSTITYSVSANGSLNDRSGVVLIGGQQFFLTQGGVRCQIALSPGARNHGSGAATNSLDVSTAPGCAWQVINTNSWINILSNASGVGSNKIYYAVQPNSLTPFSRTGTLVVDDQVCTITQDGITCTYSIVPAKRTHGHGTNSSSFDVLTTNGCPWSVENTNLWIAITTVASGTNSKPVGYTVDANPYLTNRIGVLSVQGQTFTITQLAAGCSFTLSPDSRTHGRGTATNEFDVTATNGCSWSVENPNTWITITAGASGTNSDTVHYRLEANPNLIDRIGMLTVDDQTFTITQLANVCSFTLSPTTRAHGDGAATNSFDVNTINGCFWSVGNTNPWITITAGASGTSSNTVEYTLDENLALIERIGALTVDGQTFIITQRANTCSFTLSPTTRNHGYGATNATVGFSTIPGCSWLVNNTNSWITILSANETGPGTGAVTYAVASNIDVAPRSGNIVIADENFAVTQSGYVCTYKLSPTNRNHGFGATTNTVRVDAGPCAWSAITTNDWIAITAQTATNFTYTIQPNYGTTTRTGRVAVADQVLTLEHRASTGGFVFETMAMGPSGDLTLKLNGGPPGIWEIQTSSNLVTWTKLTNITNTTGKVEFIAPATGSDKRFYRAVLP